MIPAYAAAAIERAQAPALAAAAARRDPDRFLRGASHALASLVLAHLGRAGLPAPAVPGPVPLRPEIAALAGAGVRGRAVVGLIGPGNNGADGLYALAALAARGAACTALVLTGRFHEGGAAALRAVGGRVVEAQTPAGARALARAQVVLDAVLGLRGRPGLALPAPPAGAWVIACDVPSGLDPDTGAAPVGVLRADTTLAMGALTPGLLLGAGRALSGDVRLATLPGLLDPELLGEPALRVVGEDEALRSVIAPGPADHKYSRGVLGLVAGSPRYPGAAILSARAALATGVGALAAFSRGMARALLAASVPEAVVARREATPDGPAARRVDAWVLGPGLGEEDQDLEAARRVLATGSPALVDASALAVFSPRGPGAPTLLTPHAGELRALAARLDTEGAWPDPAARPLDAARAAAAALGVVVLLKGSTTLVAAPDGTVLAACSAGPQLAVAGSGDTLAGLAGALLATAAARARTAGVDLDAAALQRLGAAAAVLHGRAGALAPAAGAGPLEEGITRVLAARTGRRPGA